MTEREVEPTAEERLAALLADLASLSEYLAERGRHTYELAQRFLEHAQQDHDVSSRAYDERQATMLGYQRYVWTEIAGLVNKLLVQYGDEQDAGTDAEGANPPPETRE
jgi:hypothetical protein